MCTVCTLHFAPCNLHNAHLQKELQSALCTLHSVLSTHFMVCILHIALKGLTLGILGQHELQKNKKNLFTGGSRCFQCPRVRLADPLTTKKPYGMGLTDL